MTNDELRALADALEPMARAPRFEDFDVPAFCAWVRACADARLAASAIQTRLGERPIISGWDESTFKLNEEVPLYAHPAPAAPQAEPCIGNDPICPCQDGDACHYKDYADGTKAWPVPQSEPKREPLSDTMVIACARVAIARIQPDEWVATDADLIDFARAIESEHGIGGSDAE